MKQRKCPDDKMLYSGLYENAEGQINQSPKIHQMPQYLVSFCFSCPFCWATYTDHHHCDLRHLADFVHVDGIA